MLPPEVPTANAATPVLPAPALAANRPVPLVVAKFRAPTPAPSGLKEVPPTPATTPLVAVARPPTATGGIVAGLKLKAVGFEPACDAPTMALLNAVVFPVKLPVPTTSSL